MTWSMNYQMFTVFICTFGLFQWTRVAMGLKGSGPYFQRNASNYGVGAYFYEIRDGKVRVIRFLSKSLTGSQLNWSTIEKECYGLYWAVKMFEEYLDNRRFILRTDHKNLRYINRTPKGKMLRWKLFLQGFDF